MPARLISELRAVVGRHVTLEAARWLDDQLAHAHELRAFDGAFSGAGRRLGTAPLDGSDVAALASLGLPWSSEVGVDECGRAALLLATLPSRSPDDQGRLIDQLIRRGEIRERQAVLRVLAALPGPERFVAIAIDACRTNVTTVFNAIACDNDFPERWFPDPAFAQMVLKALFIGVPVARIRGLAARTTDELVRMVEAFASERRAAGRDVPQDTSLFRRTS